MKNHAILAGAAAALGLMLFVPMTALAHCDGLDGPVVKAAQAALESGDPSAVLIWVRPEDEDEVRGAFDRTLVVRRLSPEAKALADRYFFETLVRIHRMGEGAPYTGLKPAGRDLGPAIPAADRALEEGSPEALVALLTGAMAQSLRVHFGEAYRARNFQAGDLEAGRNYVKTYVEFIHYAERLHEAIAQPAHGHFTEGQTDDAGR